MDALQRVTDAMDEAENRHWSDKVYLEFLDAVEDDVRARRKRFLDNHYDGYGNICDTVDGPPPGPN
jgi:hypothetical protein